MIDILNSTKLKVGTIIPPSQIEERKIMDL